MVGIKVSQGKLRVQFPAGRWKFRPSELSLSRIQPGKLVTWRQTDEDIARGDLGEVIRLDDRKVSIQWPAGHWSMRQRVPKRNCWPVNSFFQLRQTDVVL